MTAFLRALAVAGAGALAAAILHALGISLPWDPAPPAAPPTVTAVDTMPDEHISGPYPVDKVVDGDTIRVLIQGRSTPVRLIGIDTPEDTRTVECFGPQATHHATDWIADHQVWLESDPTQGEQDRYGRLLAYVWTTGPDGEQMLNRDQLAGGYAAEYTYDDPYPYQDQFQAAEQAARAQALGMWDPDTCPAP